MVLSISREEEFDVNFRSIYQLDLDCIFVNVSLTRFIENVMHTNQNDVENLEIKRALQENKNGV